MTEVVEAQEIDLDLFRGLPSPAPRKRLLLIALCSVALHLILFFGAVRVPSFVLPQARTDRRLIVHHVPLYLPRDIMTQRAPNKSQVSKSIDLADLTSPPNSQPRRSSPQPARRAFELPSKSIDRAPASPPQITPEAPQITSNQPANAPQGTLGPLAAKAPAPPEPNNSPFQNLGSETPVNPNPKLKPRTDVQSAIQGLAQENAGRHLVISDDNASAPTPGTPGSAGSDAGPHAAIELQSDPRGADFKAYLTRILAIVRGNWRRVIPESARMGTLRGRTTVEFIIDRDGQIPKLVIANPSGSDALDRAAGAGLSMSNPLPPLPDDYRGFQVRLAFTFSYNMPTQ